MSVVIRQMFDYISHRYDFMNHVLTIGRDIAWRKRAVSFITTKKAMRVLDLCGGTGDFLYYCRKRVAIECGVIADFSFNMLAHAQKKHHEKTVQIDALAISCKAESFDVVLNGFGMRNLDDIDTGISQVYTVLKNGGEFITLEFFKPTTCVSTIFYTYVAPIMIPLPSFVFRKHAPAYKYLVRSIRSFITVDEYASKCRLAGFEIKKVVPCERGIAYIVVAQKVEIL